MRKLLFIAIMFFCLNLNGQNVVKNITQWNLSESISDCLKELKINNASIYIHPYEGLIYEKYTALTYVSGDVYIIALSDRVFSYSEALKTIRHELKHVSQLHDKELVILDNNHAIYKGVKYKTSPTSHFKDKWEVEARLF